MHNVTNKFHKQLTHIHSLIVILCVGVLILFLMRAKWCRLLF
jgi:hypothetical protein